MTWPETKPASSVKKAMAWRCRRAGRRARPGSAGPRRHEVLERPRRGRRWRGHVGDDEAGRDGVGGDAELAELDGQGLGEALQTGLGRGVVGLAAVAQRRGGGEVDDAAELRRPPCASGQALAIRNAPLQVHVHDGVPVGLAHLEQQVVAEDARVVDQDRRARRARRRRARRRPRPGPRRRRRADASALPPAAVIFSTVSLQAASSRSSTATARPSAASRTAVAAPMPRAAPVTMATRWLDMGLLGFGGGAPHGCGRGGACDPTHRRCRSRTENRCSIFHDFAARG